MYNRGCAYGHNCTDQAARATPIDSATPKTKARTAAFVEAQATSPKPSVATSAAQAFADHISWSGAPRVRAKRTGSFEGCYFFLRGVLRPRLGERAL